MTATAARQAHSVVRTPKDMTGCRLSENPQGGYLFIVVVVHYNPVPDELLLVATPYVPRPRRGVGGMTVHVGRRIPIALFASPRALASAHHLN